jgi:hypothetical protein
MMLVKIDASRIVEYLKSQSLSTFVQLLEMDSVISSLIMTGVTNNWQ